MHIDLNEAEAKLLRDFISRNPMPTTIATGNGSQGYGLYAWSTDYPDEGAVKITNVNPPGLVDVARNEPGGQ